MEWNRVIAALQRLADRGAVDPNAPRVRLPGYLEDGDAPQDVGVRYATQRMRNFGDLARARFRSEGARLRLRERDEGRRAKRQRAGPAPL